MLKLEAQIVEFEMLKGEKTSSSPARGWQREVRVTMRRWSSGRAGGGSVEQVAAAGKGKIWGQRKLEFLVDPKSVVVCMNFKYRKMLKLRSTKT